MNSISSILIALNVWINYVVFVDSLSSNVVVTVNLDKLPETMELKIYNGTIDLSCCKNFKGNESGIFLILNANLTYQKCNCTTVMFTIFPFFTNISSAIITVKNEGPETYRILTNFTNTIILSQADEYFSFITCKDVNCAYEGVDQNEKIKDFSSLKIYVACSEIRPCLTYIDFGTGYLENKNLSTTYYNSKISIKNSSLETKPKAILNCRNGGKPNGKKCICPDSEDFIVRGPECESLQIRLKQKQFVYALPNSKNTVIEFSIYVTSFQGSIDVLTIKKANQIVMNCAINETAFSLQVVDKSASVPFKIDTPNRWIFIFISITNSETTAWIDDKKILLQQRLPEYYFELDGIPLILNNKINTNNKEICLSNLKVNQQIVDLYLPSYENCQPNCDQCNKNQTCIYQPFKSIGNAKCLCKIGMRSSGDSQCQLTDTGTVSLPNQKVNDVKLINDGEISIVQFIFRTFSPNGILFSMNFSSPTNFISSLKIINSELFTHITNSTFDDSATIRFYNVSDGEWHRIYYKMTNNFIEVTLDEDLPFNSALIKFDTNFIVNTDFRLKNISFGPLEISNWNKYSLTTCFNGFSLIPVLTSANQIQYPDVNSSSTTNGCDGNFCQNKTCSDKSKCENKWQNPTCVCVANFTDVNGTCEFYKCIPNPCKNGGKCTFVENNNYKCVCSEGFQGEHCESYVSNAGFLWWIILLILLILLFIIIILLIYCCCCRKRAQPQQGPDINKLHENTVFYNESAGETDYNGPPINFDLIKSPQKYAKVLAPLYPNDELKERKLAFDTNNKDLQIDHPLDYGFEGVNSDAGSISSLGSGSTDNELNIKPIEETNDKFKYLKHLYK